MSLELDPVELGFRSMFRAFLCQMIKLSHAGPFDREVEEKLRLRNPNTDPVAFKVSMIRPFFTMPEADHLAG